MRRRNGFNADHLILDEATTVPWVTQAQEFVDAAWKRHLHETEHMLLPDWRDGEEQVFKNFAGEVCITIQTCKYCDE